MKRLAKENLNSWMEYDRIFRERERKGVHWFDEKRWRKLLERFKGGSLLDIGCLDSLIPVWAKDKYPDSIIYGIDQTPLAIVKLQKLYPQINYKLGDVYITGFDDNYFDYIVMGELIEHLEEPEKAIKEAFRVLKSGGTLALSTPLEETEAGELDKEHHLWSFTQEDIRKMLGPYGEVEIELLGSDPEPDYRYHPKVILGFCKKQ